VGGFGWESRWEDDDETFLYVGKEVDDEMVHLLGWFL